MQLQKVFTAIRGGKGFGCLARFKQQNVIIFNARDRGEPANVKFISEQCTLCATPGWLFTRATRTSHCLCVFLSF